MFAWAAGAIRRKVLKGTKRRADIKRHKGETVKNVVYIVENFIPRI